MHRRGDKTVLYVLPVREEPGPDMLATAGAPYFKPFLAGGLAIMLASQVAGQSLTTLYTFPVDANATGAQPSWLLLSSNVLYGTAAFGGLYGNGTLFAINTDGTG